MAKPFRFRTRSSSSRRTNPQDFAGTFHAPGVAARPVPAARRLRDNSATRRGDAAHRRRQPRHRAGGSRGARPGSPCRPPAGGRSREARPGARALRPATPPGDTICTFLVARCVDTRGHPSCQGRSRAQALLRGRTYCIADDIHDLAVPVLAHRVRLASHADGFAPLRDEAEAAVREIVARIPVPL